LIPPDRTETVPGERLSGNRSGQCPARTECLPLFLLPGKLVAVSSGLRRNLIIEPDALAGSGNEACNCQLRIHDFQAHNSAYRPGSRAPGPLAEYPGRARSGRRDFPLVTRETCHETRCIPSSRPLSCSSYCRLRCPKLR